MSNPNPSPENRFKKGWKGGPGAPKGPRLTTRLLKLFDEKKLDEPFLVSGIQQALTGEFNFWRHIFERIDGKVADKLIHQTDDDDKPPKRIDVPLRDRRKDRRKAKDGDPDRSDSS